MVTAGQWTTQSVLLLVMWYSKRNGSVRSRYTALYCSCSTAWDTHDAHNAAIHRMRVVRQGLKRSSSKRQTHCLATELRQHLNALSHNANCHQNSSTEQSLCWEANSFLASQDIPRILLNPKGSRPYSQQPAIGPCPEGFIKDIPPIPFQDPF